MNDPLVTVVVAANGRVEYLGEAIGSALAQRYQSLEVLVTDDGRGDAVASLVRAIDDHRCRYQQNAERLGPAGNHVAGFRAARGRYISILNHDDLWQPDFLSELVPPLETNQSVVVSFSDHSVIDASGAVLEEETRQTARRFVRDTLAGGTYEPFDNLLVSQAIPLAMASVFRRSALDVDHLPTGAGPAYDLWITYLLCGTRGGAFYVPRRLSCWRAHPESITSQGGLDWATGAAACWRAVADNEAMAAVRPEARLRLAQALLSAGASSLESGKLRDARRFAFESLRARPSRQAILMAGLSSLPVAVARAALARRRDRRADV